MSGFTNWVTYDGIIMLINTTKPYQLAYIYFDGWMFLIYLYVARVHVGNTKVLVYNYTEMYMLCSATEPYCSSSFYKFCTCDQMEMVTEQCLSLHKCQVMGI